jgi:hypothetical protein
VVDQEDIAFEGHEGWVGFGHEEIEGGDTSARVRKFQRSRDI